LSILPFTNKDINRNTIHVVILLKIYFMFILPITRNSKYYSFERFFDFYKILHTADNWPNRSKCIFSAFQRTRHRVLWYTIRWTTYTIKRPIAVTSFYAVKWLALVLVPTIIHHLAFVCEDANVQKWTPCVRILYGGDFPLLESRISYFKY